MSVVYKILILVVFFTLSGAGLAAGERGAKSSDLYKEGEAVCNSSGECSMDVGREGRNIVAACDAPRASISWNRNIKGVFLIACDCKCTSHDNTGWLIGGLSSSDERKVQKLYLGKAFTVEALARDPASIPDIMVSHPLCEKVDAAKLSKSVFVTLLKQSKNNQSVPYCFLPVYIMADGGRMEIKTNDVGSVYGESLRVEDFDSVSRFELLRYVDGFQVGK